MSKEQDIFTVIGGFLLLPIKEIERNDFMGPKTNICYWRISVTLRSGRAGLNCTYIGDFFCNRNNRQGTIFEQILKTFGQCQNYQNRHLNSHISYINKKRKIFFY